MSSKKTKDRTSEKVTAKDREKDVEKDAKKEAGTTAEPERQAHYFSRPALGKGGPSKLRQQFSRGMTCALQVCLQSGLVSW